MKKQLIFVLMTVMLSYFGAMSQQTINKIKDRGTVILGTSGQQNPYSFHDENDSLIGIDIEIARALAEGMGVELEIKELEFSKLLVALKAGDVDFVMSGLSMKVARNMEFNFAGPYWQTDKAVLTSKNKLKNVDIDALNKEGVKLLAQKNSTSAGIIADFYPNAELELVDNIDQAVEKLRNGEGDGLVADYETCVMQAVPSKDLSVLYIKDVPIFDPLGIAINPDDTQFLNLLENFLDAVDASGYMKSLKKKYYGK